jgi:hypothetical protein
MGFAKTDGWLAGSESDALPHDRTRGLGDGEPRTAIPRLIAHRHAAGRFLGMKKQTPKPQKKLVVLFAKRNSACLLLPRRARAVDAEVAQDDDIG